MTTVSIVRFPRQNDIPAGVLQGIPVEQRQYLIGGELRRWSGPVEDVHSPICITAQGGLKPVRLGSYPRLTRAEAHEALAAAASAYDRGRGAWPTMPVAGRIECMEAFAFRMKAHRDTIARLIMWEVGKTLTDSQNEFDRTLAYIFATIEALKNLDRISSRFAIEEGIAAQIRRGPLGVVLCMGPYNYPLNETFTTLIPALIMGNAVIFKPPKIGVLPHAPLVEAFQQSFPPGVVNTVYGEGEEVVSPLMQSGRIDVLAFIGTSHVADVLKKEHPQPHRLRSALGLEAKNPAIILPDADIDHSVRECILGTLSFNGQRCTALKIIFVHRSIADRFVDAFGAAVDSLGAGMPWEKGVMLTPLPERGKTDYLGGLIADAAKAGARVANAGGGTVDGTYFHPAVVYPVTSATRLWREEQFGPVIPVAVFDDVAEPVDYIVESNYGQQVSVFGTDPAVIGRLVDPLVNQVCRVNINSQCQRGPDVFPFNGRKDSAEGTLSVSDALRTFSIRTLVATKLTDANRGILTDITRNRRSAFLSTDFLF